MFLYYLPKYQGTPTSEKMQKVGLGYAFDEPGLHSCETRIGPDSSGGTVAATQSIPQQFVRFDTSQTWRKIPGNSLGAWVGMWNDEARRPSPSNLQRTETVIGLEVELEDGNKWLLPVACRWVEQEGDVSRDTWLPRVRRYNDLGQWEPGAIAKRYRALWDEVAVPYADALVEAIDARSDENGLPPESVAFQYDIDTLLVRCLQENYRVGPCEVSMLEAFTSKSSMIAGDVLIDSSGYMALKKKAALDRLASLNSGSGEPVSTTVE